MDKISKVKYGQEIGPNLQKIAKKILKNQNLCKLLVNSDLDPLNPILHPDEIKGSSLLHKNVLVVPLLSSNEQTTQSKVVLMFSAGNIGKNSDNENLLLLVNVYTPFSEWLVTGETLRPFAIMSEIRKSIQDARINGLGEIRYEGFDLSTLTEEMGCYVMRFSINAFS